MYENGSQDYLEILFSSKDISDLLNRTEYIEKISSYDQGIFEKYKETKRQITQKKSEIEVQLSELKDMQAEETAEKETLTNLREKKKEELKRYNEQIDISQEKADEYARQAAEAEAEVEKLLQERQKEIDRGWFPSLAVNDIRPDLFRVWQTKKPYSRSQHISQRT